MTCPYRVVIHRFNGQRDVVLCTTEAVAVDVAIAACKRNPRRGAHYAEVVQVLHVIEQRPDGTAGEVLNHGDVL